MLDNKPMNHVVKFNELPNVLKLYLDVHIQNQTRHYIYEATCDWNKIEKADIGFQCVKDYYKEIHVFFPNKRGGYTSVELGDFWKDSEGNYRTEITQWTNCSEDYQKIEEAVNQVVTDRTILRDYDKEAFDEALELGDMDMIEDIIGDRDLAEFI